MTPFKQPTHHVQFLRFVRQNRRYLLFGFLLSFCSSFGQTWFIGLFNVQLREEFKLTHGSYGSWYAVATLSSAVCLSYVGRLIDRVDLRLFTALVCVGLAVSCLLMSLANGLLVLVLVLFGLRLFGCYPMGSVRIWRLPGVLRRSPN